MIVFILLVYFTNILYYRVICVCVRARARVCVYVCIDR